MAHPSKMLPLNSMNLFYTVAHTTLSSSKKILFELKLLSQGKIEQDHLSENA